MQPVFNPFTRIFQLSLASFLLAALTGFFYRYGLILPLPGDLNLVNIRHAHSHLMFFNWITPPLMAWMILNLQHHSDQVIRYPRYKICLYSMLFLGFLSYPFFLFYGYRGVSAGNLQLPLAAIISGLVMITWYWFAWLYFHDRKKAESSLTVQLSDAAIIALIISSLGAWGVSIFQFGNSSNPLFSSALTHFFLSVFTEGWAILGVLGLIWSRIKPNAVPRRTGWLWKPVLLGSMLITPLGFSQSIITTPMLYSAKAGVFLIAGSLSIHFFYFIKADIRSGIVWYSVIGLLAVKILIQASSLLPFDFWIGNHGLRILYLHVLLLGFVTISMIWFLPFLDVNLYRTKSFFAVSVWLVILSLLAISGYWPRNLQPPYLYHMVLFAAILPFFAAAWIWAKSFKIQSEKNTTRVRDDYR